MNRLELPAQPAANAFSRGRVWGVPAIALLAMAALLIGNANQPLFLTLNHAAAALPSGLWAALTAVGDTLVAFALLLPFVRRRPDLAAAIALAILFALVYVHSLKLGLNLPRPPGVFDADAFSVIGPAHSAGAFPSGHAATAFAMIALLSVYLPSWGRLLPLLVLAGLAGLSRIAVGVHWPLDVLAGAAGGWLAGLAGSALANRWQALHHPWLHAAVQALLIAGAAWLMIGHDSGYAEARRFEQAIAFVGLALFFRPLPNGNQA